MKVTKQELEKRLDTVQRKVANLLNMIHKDDGGHFQTIVRELDAIDEKIKTGVITPKFKNP